MQTETKEERKLRKARERSGLSPIEHNKKNYVVCLKWGNKYSSEYVNRLNNMVARNLTLPYEFVCFTENTSGIDKSIRTEPLPTLPITGWWYKPYFLSNRLPFRGTLLFLDLDLIVFKNIDSLFSYEPGKFCIIRDFNRNLRPGWNRMNSSVFRTEIGQFNNFYNEFEKNSKTTSARYRGDQDWMFKVISDYKFWPDEWIQSYKWEMRDRNKLKIVNGKRNFDTIENPKIKPNTSVAVFHGDPNPGDCLDPWVVDNWR